LWNPSNGVYSRILHHLRNGFLLQVTFCKKNAPRSERVHFFKCKPGVTSTGNRGNCHLRWFLRDGDNRWSNKNNHFGFLPLLVVAFKYKV